MLRIMLFGYNYCYGSLINFYSLGLWMRMHQQKEQILRISSLPSMKVILVRVQHEMPCRQAGLKTKRHAKETSSLVPRYPCTCSAEIKVASC